MDPITALDRTDAIVTDLIGRLTADHRHVATPCDEWDMHDLIAHMCGGGHMIAGALQGQAPPDPVPDFLADGPAAGWAGTVAHLREAATPEAMAATHQLPFGEYPGAAAVSVITADHLVHAWDMAKAADLPLEIDHDLAEWALATWQQVVPAEGRSGPGFKDVVTVADDAPAVDRMAAYTGRQP